MRPGTIPGVCRAPWNGAAGPSSSQWEYMSNYYKQTNNVGGRVVLQMGGDEKEVLEIGRTIEYKSEKDKMRNMRYVCTLVLNEKVRKTRWGGT